MSDDRKSACERILRDMLRERRQKAGLSQRELAQVLGKPQSWVCRHERGDLRMDYLELRALLKALDVSVVGFVKSLEQKLSELDG